MIELAVSCAIGGFSLGIVVGHVLSRLIRPPVRFRSPRVVILGDHTPWPWQPPQAVQGADVEKEEAS